MHITSNVLFTQAYDYLYLQVKYWPYSLTEKPKTSIKNTYTGTKLLRSGKKHPKKVILITIIMINELLNYYYKS